jgi:hypothetical protein
MNNWWRSSTVLRYAISIIASAVATKLGLDAAQAGSLTDWLLAGVMGLITFGPPAWNLIFRPSNAAMDAAVQADKVMAGEKKDAVVQTPSDVPNIVIKATNQNVGHS